MSNVLAVTLDEVKRSYEGTITTDEIPWATDIVDKAVRELLNKIPSITSRVAAGTLDRDYVVDKVGEAVHRVLRNPEGMASETEGDYSYRLRTIMASGNIWYPDADLIALGYISGKNSVPKTVFATPSRGWGFPI